MAEEDDGGLMRKEKGMGGMQRELFGGEKINVLG
jgi:hypothetical protein